jgi:hypothetical protein
MTGFPRPGRSYYLDDMNVTVGDRVICKCAMDMSPFTPGQSYQVLPGCMLKSDDGDHIAPSARFNYTHQESPHDQPCR